MMKTKKIPLRRCVATNEKFPKKELIRVVKNNENEVFVDESGRSNGRGAYIQKSMNALEICKKKNSLGKALEVEIPQTIYEELEKIING